VSSGKPNSSASPEWCRIDAPTLHSKPPCNKAATEGDFGKFIVHGHTPTLEPEVRKNRINIDTGAFATSVLTALVLEGENQRFLDTR
jgi:hypothetical protein